MTLHHDINAQPMQNFLKWQIGLKIQNPKVEFEFFYVIVLPSNKEPQYAKQTISMTADDEHQNLVI